MCDAGLAEGRDLGGSGFSQYALIRRSWEGHEFLDAARNDTVWNMAKALVKDKGLGLGLDALKAALGQVIKAMIG